jgi:hypothetical protein
VLQLVVWVFFSAKPSSPWPVAPWPPRNVSTRSPARHTGGPALVVAVVVADAAVEVEVEADGLWVVVVVLAAVVGWLEAAGEFDVELEPPHAATAVAAAIASRAELIMLVRI